MRIQYQLTEDEFREAWEIVHRDAVRAARANRPRFRVAAGSITFFGLLIAYAALKAFLPRESAQEPTDPRSRESLIGLGITLALAAAVGLYLYFTSRSPADREWAAWTRGDPTVEIETTPDALHLRRGADQREVPWTDIQSFDETRNCLLIYIPPAPLIIPKRGFENPQALDEFRVLMRSSIFPYPPE